MNQFFMNKGVKWIGLGWIGFISENLILSHNRQYIIQEAGDDAYHMTYNLLSTISCGAIAYGYYKHGKMGPMLKPRSRPLQLAALTVQTVGLIMMSQAAPAFQVPVEFRASDPSIPTEALTSPVNPDTNASEAAPAARKLYVRCPMDFRHKQGDNVVYGLDRVSRHGMLWSFGLIGLGSALVTPYAPTAVMFSFPLVFALIGSEHQDYRYRRGNGGYLDKEREHETSNIPFAALLTGRQKWGDVVGEIKVTNAAMAGCTGLLLALRRWK